MAHCEKRLSSVFSGTSGSTLPTHKAVRPSGLDGLRAQYMSVYNMRTLE